MRRLPTKYVARCLVWLLAVALCAYMVVCALLFFLQRSFIYHPTPASVAAAAQTMRFQGEGADLVVSTHSDPGSHAVLYFGGNGEDVSQSLPLLVAAFPHTAIYALHYRGYSGSTGKATEKNLVADGMALFDDIHKEHGDVTVIGRSLGSGIAIHVASLRQASRLVLVTPYNSILELAAERFRFLPISLLLQDKYESWRYAPRISVPTTVIAADQDGVIPMASTQRLLTHFKTGLVSFIVIRDAGHNDISDHSEYVPALHNAESLGEVIH